MRRQWIRRVFPIAIVVLTGHLVLAGSEPIELGKQPGQTKGRWLKVHDPDRLATYREVVIGDIETEIVWKKDGKETPIDEQLLRDRIRQELTETLRASGLFERVWDASPESGRTGVLRIDCDLLVEPGNRAARYVVGLGAGKSKSVLELHLEDFADGRELGLYHGYGVGSGLGFKVAGGGARKMTEDDVQENAKMFGELLKEAYGRVRG